MLFRTKRRGLLILTKKLVIILFRAFILQLLLGKCNFWQWWARLKFALSWALTNKLQWHIWVHINHLSSSLLIKPYSALQLLQLLAKRHATSDSLLLLRRRIAVRIDHFFSSTVALLWQLLGQCEVSADEITTLLHRCLTEFIGILIIVWECFF